jgi:hypothetical protein
VSQNGSLFGSLFFHLAKHFVLLVLRKTRMRTNKTFREMGRNFCMFSRFVKQKSTFPQNPCLVACNQPQLLSLATVSRNVPYFAVSRNGCEKFREIAARFACFTKQQYAVSSKTPSQGSPASQEGTVTLFLNIQRKNYFLIY